MIFFTTIFISMFITIALIPIFRNLAIRFNLVDIPDERKVHESPMPKTGGVAMAIGALVPIYLLLPETPFFRAILTGSGVIIFFGLIDDIKNLGYRSKLLGQLAAALIVIFFGGIRINSLGNILPMDYALPWFLSIPLTLFVITGVTNAVNLSDGLDGLAGGISMLSFICIGYLGYCMEDLTTTMISIAVIGSIIGFLRFNTFPATVFMGDTGSQLLGFLAITLSLHLTQGDTPFSPLLPMILLGFPVLDTLTVMMERISEGGSPFIADKKHFHHRLMGLGLFHNEAVFVIYILQAILTICAYFLRFHSEWLLLIFYLSFSGIILGGFIAADRTEWKMKRYDLIDRIIKGKLRIIRDSTIPIKVSFRIVKYCIPCLFLFTGFIPAQMPYYFYLLSMVMGIIILWMRLNKKEWLGGAIRLSLCMVIPFLVYLSETGKAYWLSDRTELIYNLSFVFITVFILLTLKLTRRQKGLKTTPMDFMAIFIALIFASTQDTRYSINAYGMTAVHAIVLIFGYDTLLGELRKEFDGIAMATIITLLVFSARGAFITF